MTTYHFIGLGGIGMSALARILLQKGNKVQGSDAAKSPLLDQLQKEGALCQVGHRAESLPVEGTVVYSTDIKETNVELTRARELQLPLLQRADLLDLLMQGKKPLLVTGTHGKTTTTALLSEVLYTAKLDPSFVIGGILRSLNTNGKAGKGDFFVAEADESNHSFLRTRPFGAIVTNLENDHLEYWQTPEKLEEAFREFFALADHPEYLFWCRDDPRLSTLPAKGVSYGFSEEADWVLSQFRQTDKGIAFDLAHGGKVWRQIGLSLFGRHNALNGAAVFGLAMSLGVPEEAIRKAFENFSGTQRRLEWKGEAHKVSLYDDYGHHPTEISATLRALRDHVGERRLVAIFQPHRNTRVRDLLQEFTTCFGDADLVILTDIYSAGEAPIEGISSAALYTRMREKLGAKLHFLPRQHLEAGSAELLSPLDVVVTIGAGDVTKAGIPILSAFAERAPKWKIGVICGGTSAEHPVSLMSGRNISKALDPSVFDVRLFGISKEGNWIAGPDAIEKLEQKSALPLSETKLPIAVLQELLRCDVCVPVLHGPQGEDGMTQGLFDTLQIPYVGCDYRTGAICMQKSWTKQIAQIHNVPTPPFLEIDRVEYQKNPKALLEKIGEQLRYPVWIKPVHLGSSIGIARADSPSDVHSCAELAFTYDDAAIVEQHVEGRQIEFALIGNEKIRMALPCEVLTGGAFLDYERKYGANASPFQIPPHIPESHLEIGKELAARMYKATGCKGLARIDFFYDGHFWFNEINPFPGMTNTSAFPKMWETTGVSMQKICDELIALAMQRTRRLLEIRGR